MANPFYGKMKSTGADKMAKETGTAKNYESQGDKADRRYGKLRKTEASPPKDKDD